MMIVTAVALSALLLSTPARSTEASASEMQSGRAYTTYAVAPQERNGAYRDRAKFASAFRKVEEGMTKAAVKRLLGRPDVVASAPSAEPYQSRWQAEQWRYGAKDAGSFAALGSIWFSDKGVVSGCRGNRDLPAKGLPGEATLRQVLQAIDDAADEVFNIGGQCDPLATIRAVNKVVALPNSQRLPVVREYFRENAVRGARKTRIHADSGTREHHS
jgi:hypothetical protein